MTAEAPLGPGPEAAQAGGGLPGLLLVYRLPAGPARLRIAVWRQLKAAGAVYLVDSVAALPSTPPAECLLRRLQHGISDAGGSAQLLAAGALAGQAGLIAAFNRARDDEYLEIVAQCRDILAGITARRQDAEVQRAALAGLARSYERVRSRDVLGASQVGPAAAALAECRESVDRALRVGS